MSCLFKRGLPHAADLLRLYDDDRAHLLAPAVPGVRGAEVFLGEHLDVVDRALGGDIDHPAPHLEVARWVLRLGLAQNRQ